MSRLVLDNTVTMAWCFSDEATEFTKTLLLRLSNSTDSALVPALWLYEVANVVELAVRKGRIPEEKAIAFFESLADLPIEVENPSRTQVFVAGRMLAGQYQLTSYDAAYLELAFRHKLPIASLDRALMRAAWAAGLNTVQA
ncbi:MAG: type II toxin-antitoxin system VapC family toxin [Bryobacteraceae bacterium]|jgi:predicted nucleic acid-binding protein